MIKPPDFSRFKIFEFYKHVVRELLFFALFCCCLWPWHKDWVNQQENRERARPSRVYERLALVRPFGGSTA